MCLGQNTNKGNQIEANNAFAHLASKEKKMVVRTEEVRSDKIYHAPVLDQIVLEWIARQDHATPGLDVLQSL